MGFEYSPGPLTTGQSILSVQGLGNTTALMSVVNFSAGGSQILKTTNGGSTWVRTTTATQFAGRNGFCEFIPLFDANEALHLVMLSLPPAINTKCFAPLLEATPGAA
jgi:hypothetical protein